MNRIRMEKTIKETLQRSGVVERMNMTIKEHTRLMRLHYDCHDVYPDAINIATFNIPDKS